jgi:endonuclease I
MNRLLLLVSLSLLWCSTWAQIPDGYYDNASGLNGQALQTALHNIIDDHDGISYDNVKIALQILDQDPLNTDNIQLIYKGISIPKADWDISPDGWNREHLWPQSHGNFGTSIGPGTDLHALRPSDITVNSSRGNKDFDDGGEAHSEATGCYTDADSWQVRDAVKGDVARAIMYMSVRYEYDGTSGDEPDLILMDAVTESSSGEYGYLGVLSTLLEWHQDDPVDQTEIDRNNAIFNDYQHNRNPFIDHPEYAALIWDETIVPEPSNHAANFSAHTITLHWTDAVGDVLPTAYLVRMSDAGFDDISAPGDGLEVANDFYNKNVSYGVEKCVFGGLTTNTIYYFKIFAYSGSGATRDYKTGEGVMQVSMMVN